MLRGELDALVGSLDEEEGRKGQGHQSCALEAVGEVLSGLLPGVEAGQEDRTESGGSHQA